MRFIAIAAAVGFGGVALSSIMDSAAEPGESLPSAGFLREEAAEPAVRTAESRAVRLIDLKSGATCKAGKPNPQAKTFSAVPFAADCAKSPSLARIAYWRSAPDGSLIMADRGGGIVLRFVPRDGVLYESVYPRSALITIVPARS